MLLRLVPPTPLPTILFTLSFPTLPQSLPLPAAWEAHLQVLADTHLSSPPSLHALDKSVAWTALLDTVTFDLASLTVTCIFIDGMHEEWPLTNRCVDLLESVIADVNRSAVEAENEREPAPSECQLIPAEPAPPPPPPLPKPKKRRSLIASLMASFVTSSVPPPAPPAPLPTSPEEPEPLPCNGIPASRFLRRRARSTLVDAFRRFVVTELSARFRSSSTPQSQYPYALWVTRSTMRRAAEEMARVIEEAQHHDDRDRDSDTASSITDGSSVHTPLDSHDPSPPPPPRKTLLTPSSYHAYISLKALHHRLHDLACRLQLAGREEEEEERVLEVRSRRRAWSVREYLPESSSSGVNAALGGASMALVGLSVPVRPSPLCQAWTADDVDVEPKRGRRVEWSQVLLRRTRSLGLGEREGVTVKVKSREAEDVDELARDVAERLSVGDEDRERETRVRCYEVDDEEEDDEYEEDEDDENEFDMIPARPTSPPPLPWPRSTYPKIARVAPPALPIEDNLMSAKFTFSPEPDPTSVVDV